MTKILDAIDQKILRNLVADGRQTHFELSEKVGLSPSPTARRVKALEEAGYITGTHAEVDSAKLGFAMSVFVSVRLAQQVKSEIENFEKEIVRYDEVVDCWLMTGKYDYLIRVVVRDLHEFEAFLNTKLTGIQGLASVESSIPIRQLPTKRARLR